MVPLKTRSIAKYCHPFQSLLTSQSESVDWDSFLAHVGGYEGTFFRYIKGF